jgi:hypothetical protein
VTQFCTSIPTKKSFTELFGITQTWNDFTRTYLKISNEEMLKVEDLIELVTSEAFISGVREKAFMDFVVRSTR